MASLFGTVLERFKKTKEKTQEIISESADEQEVVERRQQSRQAAELLLEREKHLDQKQTALDKRLEKIRKQEAEIEEIKTVAHEIRDQQKEKLQKIAKLTQKQAADKLLKMTQKDITGDLQGLVVKLQAEAKLQAQENAKTILLAVMERLASDVTAEKTTSSIKLSPSNLNVKGQIIGRDGRNITILQKVTGVDILLDSAPNKIVVSSFNPLRREVARRTLEMLIKDGRIQPARIESSFEKAQKEIHKDVVRTAEMAAREVGVRNIPPAILELLGQLKFRTSYGQNVLKHSVEMAHLAGLLAEQIGADVDVCKYAALVHDLGKALTHKIKGKHHHLSGEVLRKHGVSEAVAHAAEAHHDDIEATTPEAIVVRVVDAVSAARPGARSQSTEQFVERMQTLENIANSFEGIENAFAISAGREIRVFVRPDDLDDLQTLQIARDIAVKVESMMNYPGTIKVTVIRETKAVEYAK